MADIQTELARIALGQKFMFKVSQRRKRQRLLVTKILLDYARHSTLHGLRYITDRGFLVFEKLFWLVMFIASLSLGCYHISNVYDKWKTSPVIVSLSEKQVSVGTVPFPSITICPQIKSKASVYQFSKQFKSLNTQLYGTDPINYTDAILNEVTEYNAVAMLCRNHNFFFKTVKSNSNYDMIQKFYDVSPSYEDTFGSCYWRGQNISCPFKKVLTEEGVCFNFNGVSAQELFRNELELGTNITENSRLSQGWTPDTGYNDSEKDPYPHRGSENVADPDLIVELTTMPIYRDILCNSHSTGFKIYLHHPYDLPQSSLYYFAALEDQVTSLAVDLDIVQTSQTLMHYKTELRRCYFAHEKYLQFFKLYTTKNCILECLANITLRRCQCVSYYMPRKKTTNICTLENKECLTDAYDRMVLRERKINWKLSGEEDTKTCRCLPPCNYVEYDAQVLKTYYNGSSRLRYQMEDTIFDYELDNTFEEIQNLYSRIDNSTLSLIFSKIPNITTQNLTCSKLEVYFRKPLFISMRRSELFGWTDFVANVGGLLGLFLGFSVLSLIEILYYLTVRIGVALKRDLDENE